MIHFRYNYFTFWFLMAAFIFFKHIFQVPLGYKGTVVAIQPVIDPNPVRQKVSNEQDFIYDILFDEPFEEGITIDGVAEKRLFKVSNVHLINISYGQCKYIMFKHKMNYYIYYCGLIFGI